MSLRSRLSLFNLLVIFLINSILILSVIHRYYMNPSKYDNTSAIRFASLSLQTTNITTNSNINVSSSIPTPSKNNGNKIKINNKNTFNNNTSISISNNYKQYLSDSYYECFRKAFKKLHKKTLPNIICSLPSNFTVTFIKYLSHGEVGQIWSVNITNHVSKHSDIFALKYSVYDMLMEYEVMYKLHEYDNSLNVLWLHTDLKYYYWYKWSRKKLQNMFFMKQLVDPQEFADLNNIFRLEHLKETWSSLWLNESVDIDGSPLQFILNCYKQIIAVFDALNSIKILDIDFNLKNILIDKFNHKCYLIDFGISLDWNNETNLIPFFNETKLIPLKNIEYYDLFHSPKSPKLYHNFRSITKKLRLNQMILHESTTIIQSMKQYAMLYPKYQIFSDMFRLFVGICGNMEINHGGNAVIGRKLMEMNEYFFSWIKISESGNLDETMLQRAWCQRQEIVNIFDASFTKLLCFTNFIKEVNSDLVTQFLSIVHRFYDDEKSYLDKSICKSVRQSNEKIETHYKTR